MTGLTETALAALTPDRIVDARGRACPGPLLEARKALPGVAVGNVLELWSTDPGTRNDVGAWAAKVGHAFLGSLPADGYERVFVRRER